MGISLLRLSASEVFPYAQYIPFSTHAAVWALAVVAKVRMSVAKCIVLRVKSRFDSKEKKMEGEDKLRRLTKPKEWLRDQARCRERYVRPADRSSTQTHKIPGPWIENISIFGGT